MFLLFISYTILPASSEKREKRWNEKCGTSPLTKEVKSGLCMEYLDTHNPLFFFFFFEWKSYAFFVSMGRKGREKEIAHSRMRSFFLLKTRNQKQAPDLLFGFCFQNVVCFDHNVPWDGHELATAIFYSYFKTAKFWGEKKALLFRVWSQVQI